MKDPEPKVVVARFENGEDLAEAQRILNQALRDESMTIYQGAVVSRNERGKVRIQDFKDLRLGDALATGVGITLDVGLGIAQMVAVAAIAGFKIFKDGVRMVTDNAGKTLDITTTMLAIPGKRMLGEFTPREEVVAAAAELEPGDVAVVVVADRSTANALATDLKKSGGELV